MNYYVQDRGFKTVHSINALGSGDVAISARSQIEFKTIIGSDESPVGYDTIGIRTRNLENNLNILAVYRHPRGVVYARDLNALRRHVDIGGDAIILGDFNVHNTYWNCDITSSGGETLLNVMQDSGFFCINVDTKSRAGVCGQRDSNIDLLFGNADHYFEWTGWVRSRWRLSPLELQWSETALLDSNSDPWKEMDPQNMSLYL
ncbi:uncharacterized protein LOC105841052 isoform X2 [Monomorium pharaonis]|uniref:uncharacterized protein LOC105841052 isoform X2 n=1 Tax=Monomorium pharaonis TaxID=307658 RepID=UPI001747D59D|nr:uncharacterized protein LOC105841052 isoform X2 [Monomorium pharaonis]